MSDPVEWLRQLGGDVPLADGLVVVEGYDPLGRPPEEVVIMEKARHYEAYAAFFRPDALRQVAVAEAFVYVSEGPELDPAFGELHRRLWSWGGVPLVYRKIRSMVQLFRCGHEPDFDSETGKPVCKPAHSLNLLARISSDPWWDAARLRNGTLWDDPEVCKKLLSHEKAASRSLIAAVKTLNNDLNTQGILPKKLRRRLLILTLLVAYLEDRQILEASFFGRYLPGARSFFKVLGDGNALVGALAELERRFNGNVFSLQPEEQAQLRGSSRLEAFAKLVEGREEPNGQRTLWRLYSFGDLPVELISHIYQLFVEDASSSVYTPPFLVRLMLEEALDWKRIAHIEASGQVILDPCCGSGIFLVEAFKRLILHWRSTHEWAKPPVAELHRLVKIVHGVDVEGGAIELAAFSLCIALCDALDAKTVRASKKLFPALVDGTLHESCFFAARRAGLLSVPIGALVGNPPFHSGMKTESEEGARREYEEDYGRLPDKQIAYLFLHEGALSLQPGGILCLLQQYNLLYNQGSRPFRNSFFKAWDVREVLDLVSVRGLFKQGTADTKVVVIVAEATKPTRTSVVLHATLRRTGRVLAEQGFELDHYDMHWLPHDVAVLNDDVWRSDLLGGGRVLGLVERLRGFRTIQEFANRPGWDIGEGFIGGDAGVGRPAEHIIGKPLLPSSAFSEEGIDPAKIETVPEIPIEAPRTNRRFTQPMVLVHEQMELNHGLWTESYLTYKNQVVGICGTAKNLAELRSMDSWMRCNKRVLKAFAAATSIKLFTQHATTLSAADIYGLPYPKGGDLDISVNEQIVIDDIVDHYRALVRFADKSSALKPVKATHLKAFAATFAAQVGATYKGLRALPHMSWPGAVCQPFVFGEGEADWSGAEALQDRLASVLRERRGPSLTVTRIARLYDGPFLFMLKPDRVRYWLRSAGLRDADETLADLRRQGY